MVVILNRQPKLQPSLIRHRNNQALMGAAVVEEEEVMVVLVMEVLQLHLINNLLTEAVDKVLSHLNQIRKVMARITIAHIVPVVAVVLVVAGT